MACRRNGVQNERGRKESNDIALCELDSTSVDLSPDSTRVR